MCCEYLQIDTADRYTYVQLCAFELFLFLYFIFCLFMRLPVLRSFFKAVKSSFLAIYLQILKKINWFVFRLKVHFATYARQMNWGCQVLLLIKMAFGAHAKSIEIQNAQNVRRWPVEKSSPMSLEKILNLKETATFQPIKISYLQWVQWTSKVKII